MKKTILILLMLLSAGLFSQEIKIASVAPENSPWGEYLKRLAKEWEDASSGKIKVKIFHGGILGNEQDSYKKMKLGQIQGLVSTSFGLANFSPSIVALSVPFLIRDEKEMDYVVPRIKDYISAKIKEKGGVMAFLSLSGWIYYFSTKSLRSPHELQSTILAGSPYDNTLNEVLKKMGYKVIVIPSSETLLSLKTKSVESLVTSPVLLASSQAFALANNMVDLKVAPFLGSLVIDNRVWMRIPKELQNKFLQISANMEKLMEVDVLKLEQDAISIMKKNGLNSIELTENEKNTFYKEFERGQEFFVSEYPRDVYDKVKEILVGYRK